MPVPPPVALAQATEALRPASVREPCWEPKWDGWRAVYAGGRLWSRRGTELTRYSVGVRSGATGFGAVLAESGCA